MMGRGEMNEEVNGAEELDIVQSGQEEIMTTACKDSWNVAVSKGILFRDACYVRAMKKLYQFYEEGGITF